MGLNPGCETRYQDNREACAFALPSPGPLRVSQSPPVTGLSWQDGITQYVISQEMERIPRLRPPPLLEPVARDR